MAKEPHHFTKEDLIRSFFGSFIVSISFLFAGSLKDVALAMSNFNVFCVMLLTFVMLTFEIYLLSYKYVNDRKRRPFLEFWAKRFFSIILSSYIAIFLLLTSYGVNFLLTAPGLFKLGVAMFLPATTVGGAMEILRKR